MNTLRCGIALALLAVFAPAALEAQGTGTVTGSVIEQSTTRPLPGAQVVIGETGLGALTDSRGRYQVLNVPAGQHTVRVQIIGYGEASQTVTVVAGEAVTADFALEETAVSLDRIVVTALGIERQEAAIGVATETVGGDELAPIEANIVSALSGQVAGVNISQSASPGGSARIVIRGANSITGSNEPLFVVDGVPVDNSSSRVGSDDLNWGNAAMDIDPNNVASITVLKGPNAAALYGSRAANGAILITTKSGLGASQGQVTVSQHVSFEDPLVLPRFQNKFGQGVNADFAWVDGEGGGTNDEVDESWGPPLDVGLMIPQYNSPVIDGVRQPTPWVSNPGNVDHFFKGGHTLTTNAAFSKSGDAYNLRFSASRFDQEGFVPGFNMNRLTLGLNGGVDVTDRLRANTSIQYIDQSAHGRPGIGYGGTNPLSQMIWFGRQVDIADLEANYDSIRAENGLPYNWNYSYHTNPYYLQLANSNTQDRDRLIGNISAEYDLTDWLTLSGLTGMDYYNEDRIRNFAPLQVGVDFVGPTGGFDNSYINFREVNSQLLANISPTLEGPISVNGFVGIARRDYRRDSKSAYVSDLITPHIYSIENSAVPPISTDYISRKRVNSVLGQAEIGYNNYAFLTLTGRNDWSSTLPENSRSYFYPSVSGSFIFSDAFNIQNNWLDYGKLRASWARVGNDTDPYQLRGAFVASDVFNGFPTFAEPNQLPNSNLKSETTESWEFGAELGFLGGRLGLDATYYNRKTFDLIMPVSISRASGYTSQIVNAGTTQNKGVELLVHAIPFQTEDFRWRTSFTFAKNDNTVVDLAEGVNGIQLGSLWYGYIWARKGEPFGQIVGYGYVRDSQGRIVVGSNGVPLRTSAPNVVVGNYNPDWLGGWSNEFSYKNFDLGFLLDIRRGGEIYSVTHMWGTYAGVLEKTVKGRCWVAGVPAWESSTYAKDYLPECSPETGIVFDGVMVNEAGDTVPNTRVVDAQTFWTNMYATTEAHTLDASYVKLRQLSLTFNAPQAWSNRLGLSNIQFGLIGRNLAMWGVDENLDVDPETGFDASNVQGFEYGSVPGARSIGFSVTVRP
ncbi:MAG: SusC/RagA family TonB-linked outer membrane protein [Candidatus Cloacimonetes bacterium]|nr:SusC/RagA family TonB-linked outer membrane protein [Candidatus Cloacimonadota bacterium]